MGPIMVCPFDLAELPSRPSRRRAPMPVPAAPTASASGMPVALWHWHAAVPVGLHVFTAALSSSLMIPSRAPFPPRSPRPLSAKPCPIHAQSPGWFIGCQQHPTTSCRLVYATVGSGVGAFDDGPAAGPPYLSSIGPPTSRLSPLDLRNGFKQTYKQKISRV
jgi:hypothetical protein